MGFCLLSGIYIYGWTDLVSSSVAYFSTKEMFLTALIKYSNSDGFVASKI